MKTLMELIKGAWPTKPSENNPIPKKKKKSLKFEKKFHQINYLPLQFPKRELINLNFFGNFEMEVISSDWY
jgi:hypothetical protein